MRTVPALAFVLLALAFVGCAPEIGDKCKTSGDCSLDGQRICDTAQPGGYCTVQGCDPDSCPGGSVCVEWRYDPPRTSETWCMRSCSSDGACRSGYRCVNTLDEALRSPIDCSYVARIIDLEAARDDAGVASIDRFCAATGPLPTVDAGPSRCEVDAGVDAGTDAGVDAGTDAGVDAGTDAGADAGP